MPQEDTKPQELKYFERLNISVLSIARIKDMIKTNIRNTIQCWKSGRNIPKQTFHIIGPAGVGKTEICQQIANELADEFKTPFGCMVVKCPVLSRDDYLIPFPVVSNGNTKFKMLYSDFVPFEGEEGVPDFGIYAIDEFSRGDHNLQQLMWQIQNEYKIHMKDLPKGWFVISIDNPDDQEYSMDTLEDAAGLRRQLHVYVEVSAQDFLTYAIANDYHPAVVEFIQAHPDYLYDFEAQKMGSVYANPASYEKLSNILHGFDSNGGVKKHLDEVEPLASGLLNTHKTRLFIDFLKSMKIIKPQDIFFRYNAVRKEILSYVNSGDNAKLGELITGFVTYLTTSRPDHKAVEKKNVLTFLTDIPIDTAAVFITSLDRFSRSSEEFKYVTGLHVEMMKMSETYRKQFYEEMVKAGRSS